MHSEFGYWYPVDLRVSAKELVPNHLTFFIFHHTALFSREHWPKAIGVNGMLMIEGKQMHKSKGNFVTMKNAIEKYGADATRCALMMGAEGMDDPDWRAENAKDLQAKLESLYNFAVEIFQNAKTSENGHHEKWLMSTLQGRIAAVTENLEIMKTRTALEIALFEVWNDFRWYARRKGNMKAKVLRDALKTWLKLLAPFAPHICEELWSHTQEKCFISQAQWPQADLKQKDPVAEGRENLIKEVIDDTLNVLKATKIMPKKICYYTAAKWKWKVYLKTLEKSVQGEVKMSDLMKELAADEELKKYLKEIAKFAAKIIKDVNALPKERRQTMLETGVLNESEAITDAASFLDDRFKAQVVVYGEEDKNRYDPKQRSIVAMPCRPAIYIE